MIISLKAGDNQNNLYVTGLFKGGNAVEQSILFLAEKYYGKPLRDEIQKVLKGGR